MQFVLLAALFFAMLGAIAALMVGIALKLVLLVAIAGVEFIAALWLARKVRQLRKGAVPQVGTGNDPPPDAFPE